MTKKTLIVGIILLGGVIGGAVGFRFFNRTVDTGSVDYSSLSVLRVSGNEISKTKAGLVIRFEAIVVDRAEDNCIYLFMPDEFTKYGDDPKWAISATLGSEPGVFERVRPTGRAIVTGKYLFVRDAQNGPCSVISGQLFEIEQIDYF